jgi:hypothetical protein
MIAKAIMPHILFIPDEASRHDRVFDIALIGGPGRHRRVGGIVVSAEIIPFIPRSMRNREPARYPAIPFRPAAKPDDPAMDHTDTLPCEYWPSEYVSPNERT